LTLLALDARLGGVVRSAREPMLAQLKLAWWRDRLSGDPAGWPTGEPLLARLAGWGPAARELVALVDGWEALLGDTAIEEFPRGRAAAMSVLAGRFGADRASAEAAGRRWGLAELALHRGEPAERAEAARVSHGLQARLGRAMRPLAVLAGLAERAVQRGENEALSGPGALVTAVRIGVFGR